MFSKSTLISSEPWVGSEYEQGIEGQKVLILGESHYHNCEDDDECRDMELGARTKHHRRLTHDVVEWWKDKPHSSPVSHAVPKLFDLPKSEFWNRVSFYNYLQVFKARPKDRPSEEEWLTERFAQAFQEVLDVLEPDRILVLGKDTWSFLPSNPTILACRPIPEPRLKLLDKVGNRNAVESIAYWYGCRSGHVALTMPIIHPAAIPFRVEEWKPSIQKWLAFPSKLALEVSTHN